ncbi:MAG: hypothetical protein NW223_07150 [Hyphomicrobiaceae bacterium]|nr:hypothetical protein [Hyphomicrobiaceae bacterium]
MMQYYRLNEDVQIPNRWHVGRVRRGDRNVLDLVDGKHADSISRLNGVVTTQGLPLRFFLTSFAVPIAVNSLGAAMERFSPNEVQLIPIELLDVASYVVINITKKIDCFDESKSQFTKWSADDHRPDLVGKYRQVGKLRIDPSGVPNNVHIFRIERWEIGTIVSMAMKQLMESMDAFGAKFEPV